MQMSIDNVDDDNDDSDFDVDDVRDADHTHCDVMRR